MIRLAVLLTVQDRKEKTLNALTKIFTQEGLDPKVEISVIIVDDGSVDGTTQAVHSRFPSVTILQGTGNLYWNRGMHLAFEYALKIGFDYYLWLNDDVELYPQAIQQLLQTSERLGGRSIIVGSLQDPQDKSLTYGGVRRVYRYKLLKFSLVLPKDEPVAAETMNGNCVLIPKNVTSAVGNLDPIFSHGLGDYDYGLRARKLGIPIFIIPEYVGTCARKKEQTINGASFVERWDHIRSPLGLPYHEWKAFAQRYGGLFWFFYWLSPYLKVIMGRGR
jgi:GT2 family glycosyltransferase